MNVVAPKLGLKTLQVSPKYNLRSHFETLLHRKGNDVVAKLTDETSYSSMRVVGATELIHFNSLNAW